MIATQTITRLRTQLAGACLVLGSVLWVLTWALMPMPGTTDPSFILAAVAESRTAVFVSCIVQLLSAAIWAAGLVLLPDPTTNRGQLVWFGGAALLAVGVTGSAADAIYHLVAYEVTDPAVGAAAAHSIMTRFQGPDVLLLLPLVGAFFGGLFVFAIAGVRTRLIRPYALAWFGVAPLAAIARATLPGTTGPRLAGLLVITVVVIPLAWMGLELCRHRGESEADGQGVLDAVAQR